MKPRYLTASDGARRRVLDVRFGPPHHPPGTWSTHGPPDPAATSRAFVADWIGTGGRREAKSYHWNDGEGRTDRAEPTLQRQLPQAAWWDRGPVAGLIPGYTPPPTRGGG